MKEYVPQLCLWSSSLMSPQSLSPSQIQDEAIHLPSSHRNWSVLQVRTCGAAKTSCSIQRHTKQNTHIPTYLPKQRVKFKYLRRITIFTFIQNTFTAVICLITKGSDKTFRTVMVKLVSIGLHGQLFKQKPM